MQVACLHGISTRKPALVIIHIISKHLSAIFNQCLNCGEFPASFNVDCTKPEQNVTPGEGEQTVRWRRRRVEVLAKHSSLHLDLV